MNRPPEGETRSAGLWCGPIVFVMPDPFMHSLKTTCWVIYPVLGKITCNCMRGVLFFPCQTNLKTKGLQRRRCAGENSKNPLLVPTDQKVGGSSPSGYAIYKMLKRKALRRALPANGGAAKP